MKYPIGIQSFDRLREDGFCLCRQDCLSLQPCANGFNLFLESSPSFWEESVGEYTCLLFSGAERTFRRTGNC